MEPEDSAAPGRAPWSTGRMVLAGVAAALVLLVGYLTFSGGSSHPTTLSDSTGPIGSSTKTAVAPSPTNSVSAPSGPAVRWWTSPAGGVGSTLDVEQPGAAAATLKPNPDAYCVMLKSSVQSGHSPLAITGTSGGNVVVTMKAWLAEIDALAPGAVSSAWQEVGPVLLQRLQPGTGAPPSAQTSVTTAVQVIAADASNRCHVDLSRTS